MPTRRPLCQDVGDQADGRRLAVGAGDGDQRNAGIVAGGKHVGDDRFSDRPALAERRLQMHAQSRCGVDFDDAATLGFERAQDAVADDIDAGDIEADGLRGGNRLRGKLGMDIVGDIGCRTAGREIGVVAQDDALASRRHRFRSQSRIGPGGPGPPHRGGFWSARWRGLRRGGGRC
jgi:hypothetical protein